MEIDNVDVLMMDFKNLISCIHCHEDSENADVVLETLKTIVNICKSDSNGRDAFRLEGGLDFLIHFLSTTDSTLFLEHSLKTLTYVIDENVHSQMYMTQKNIFEVLQVVLRRDAFSQTIQKNTLLLVSAIVFQNSAAQSLLNETGLIQDIITVYENCSMSILGKCSFTQDPYDVWASANSALCFAVNNPQNEKNQEVCSSTFPMAIKILEFASDILLCAVSSFLSLCTANNVRNQTKFSDCDGILVLKKCFQMFFNAVETNLIEYNNIAGNENLKSLNNIIGIINAVTFEHEQNCLLLCELGIFPLMIETLFLNVDDVPLRTKLTLGLAQCIETQNSCKQYIFENEKSDLILKENLKFNDVQLTAATKYFLQVCLIDKGKSGCPPQITGENLRKMSASNLRDKTKLPNLGLKSFRTSETNGTKWNKLANFEKGSAKSLHCGSMNGNRTGSLCNSLMNRNKKRTFNLHLEVQKPNLFTPPFQAITNPSSKRKADFSDFQGLQNRNKSNLNLFDENSNGSTAILTKHDKLSEKPNFKHWYNKRRNNFTDDADSVKSGESVPFLRATSGLYENLISNDSMRNSRFEPRDINREKPDHGDQFQRNATFSKATSGLYENLTSSISMGNSNFESHDINWKKPDYSDQFQSNGAFRKFRVDTHLKDTMPLGNHQSSNDFQINSAFSTVSGKSSDKSSLRDNLCFKSVEKQNRNNSATKASISRCGSCSKVTDDLIVCSSRNANHRLYESTDMYKTHSATNPYNNKENVEYLPRYSQSVCSEALPYGSRSSELGRNDFSSNFSPSRYEVRRNWSLTPSEINSNNHGRQPAKKIAVGKKNMLDHYVQVIIFPGIFCDHHNLISNSEMFEVVPFDEPTSG